MTRFLPSTLSCSNPVAAGPASSCAMPCKRQGQHLSQRAQFACARGYASPFTGDETRTPRRSRSPKVNTAPSARRCSRHSSWDVLCRHRHQPVPCRHGATQQWCRAQARWGQSAQVTVTTAHSAHRDNIRRREHRNGTAGHVPPHVSTAGTGTYHAPGWES